ncbi:hypothetical protein [uncultured Tateyamaria sp.]|uniref:hypothetical protein n=1 Tax=uncultured Tateyamaria sp. TaxID=455651 RepID=UPI002622F0B7|nr:hypothetical protein [uncultured Tateyamaria sp.]
MRLPLLLMLMILPVPVLAGAWLQEEGRVFLSYGATYQDDGRLDGSLYGEYGLRPKLTLGAKVDIDMTDGRSGDGTVVIFARRPVGRTDRPSRFAFEIGIGSTFGDVSDPLVRTGLSFGRGLTVRDKNGWLAIDAAVDWAVDDGTDTYKLDSTFGVSLTDRMKVMMQVFISNAGSSTTTTLAPSVIWQPDAKTPSYQLGVEADDDTVAVKFGIWRSF